MARFTREIAALETAYALRQRGTHSRPCAKSIARPRRNIFAADQRGHAIWQVDRRKGRGTRVEPEQLSLLSRKARTGDSQKRLSSILPRVRRSPVHPCVESCQLGQNGCLQCTRTQLPERAR